MPPNEPGSSMMDYLIQHSADGLSWETVKMGKHPDQYCCEPMLIEWQPVTAVRWRINMLTNHGAKFLAVQYVELLVTTTQSLCSSFLPGLALLPARLSDFLASANVAAQAMGAVPFGSGSISEDCVNSGPGIGVNFGVRGRRCWSNINDETVGRRSSWLPGIAFNGLHFVGVQFASHMMISGVRISLPTAKWRKHSKGWSHLQYTGVPYANHKTPDSMWCTIGSFKREEVFVYKKFSQLVNASAIRVIVTDKLASIDEFHVYGRLQPLPVTDGLVADFRAMSYERKQNRLGNQVINGPQAYVPSTVSFDDAQRAFRFTKGGEVIQAKVKSDPGSMPESTYTAWVRLSAQPPAGCETKITGADSSTDDKVGDPGSDNEKAGEDLLHPGKSEGAAAAQKGVGKASAIETGAEGAVAQREPFFGHLQVRKISGGYLRREAIGNATQEAEDAVPLTSTEAFWAALRAARKEGKSKVAAALAAVEATRAVSDFTGDPVENITRGIVQFSFVLDHLDFSRLLEAKTQYKAVIQTIKTGVVKAVSKAVESGVLTDKNVAVVLSSGLKTVGHDNVLVSVAIDESKKFSAEAVRRKLEGGKAALGMSLAGAVEKVPGLSDMHGSFALKALKMSHMAVVKKAPPSGIAAREIGVIAVTAIHNLQYVLVPEVLLDKIKKIIHKTITKICSIPKKTVTVDLLAAKSGDVKVLARIKTASDAKSEVVMRAIAANAGRFMRMIKKGFRKLRRKIKKAKTGRTDIDFPMTSKLPDCSGRDKGRGWLVSQIPDFGRSRSLVLSDWNGSVSINTGTMFNSTLGKAPKGQWFFVAGVFRQGGDSYPYLNGQSSEEAATADNTEAGNNIVLFDDAGRCVGKESGPKSNSSGKSKLVFLRSCQEGSDDTPMEWVNVTGGFLIWRHSDGRCARSETIGKYNYVVLDKCDYANPAFIFKKVETPLGNFTQIRHRDNNGKWVCARPRGDSTSTGAPLSLGDCALDTQTFFKEVSRYDIEMLSIGGRDSKDPEHNEALLISDVAVFNRALSTEEIRSLYAFGRPSTPGNLAQHCPEGSASVCKPMEIKKYCEYRVKHRTTCEDFCRNTEGASCLGTWMRALHRGTSCVHGRKSSCNATHERAICRCLPKVSTTETTTRLDGDVYAAGRDRSVYRQDFDSMSDQTDWEHVGPCCVTSVAIAAPKGKIIFGVDGQDRVVKLPLDDMSLQSEWVPASGSGVRSIALYNDDIFAVSTTFTVKKQVLRDMTVNSEWQDVGRCCVTSITLHGGKIYGTGKDGKLYMQTVSGLLAGKRWAIKGKGGVIGLLVVSVFIYAVGSDEAVYRQTLATLSPHTDWERISKCCVQALATGVEASNLTEETAKLLKTHGVVDPAIAVLAQTDDGDSTAPSPLDPFRTYTETSVTTTFASWSPVALKKGWGSVRCVDPHKSGSVLQHPRADTTEEECRKWAHSPASTDFPHDAFRDLDIEREFIRRQLLWTHGTVRFYQYCESCKQLGERPCELVVSCSTMETDYGQKWNLYVNVNRFCPQTWSAIGMRKMTRACDRDQFVVMDELECQVQCWLSHTAQSQRP
eukprot:TRINITY_DN27290_c0_g1_i2.p1 TRINITY_DN27290_c0_g1~~TRINITY_DN27290_c0_g1_i2.p1  ORF type:complete len:1564 (-),score=253.55 TRINITY_DN27290_c0_g1_i2:336-5027(-)